VNRTEIVAVAWVAVRDRRLLVARAAGQDAFYLPGGKPEPGETFAAAAVRETWEETGVRLEVADLTHYADFHAPAHGRGPDTDVRLICFTAPSTAEPAPSSEIEELAWFTTADAEACAPAVRLLLARLRADDLID
jgi:8-oxo-dGTP diphosphatase